MPYDVSKTKDGYVIKKKDTGEVVARPKDMKGVKGYIYHSTKGEEEEKRVSFNNYLNEARRPYVSFIVTIDVYPSDQSYGEKETENWIEGAIETGMQGIEHELGRDAKKVTYNIKRKR